MKKYVYILLMTLGLIGMYSCENVLSDEDLAWNKEEDCYADLTISMNVPSLNVESRTLASDPKNVGGSWTNWEKFVDGALLYRVTLFVIDENDKLVAYRNFYSGSPDFREETDAQGGNGFYETSAVNTSAHTGVAVKATFSHQNPMHGSIEKLKPGTYKLIAVANYAPIVESGTEGLLNTTLGLDAKQSYAGLGSVAEDDGNNNGLGGSFTSIIDGIIGTPPFNGVGNFNQEYYPYFFDYKLNSGKDRVCKQLPQPLVMIRKVTLTSGDNQIKGMLSRTFARVRLEVKNNDTSSLIGVSGLSFQDNYASQNAYLFNDVGATVYDDGTTDNLHNNFALYDGNDDTSLNTKGTLGVTSADAITPALEVMKRLPAGSPYTMLDCYILEGMISATYAFEFTASYWANASGGAATENYRITSFYGGSGNDSYGLLEFFVYIRDAATSGNQEGNTSSGSNYILTSNTENQFSQSGTVTATTPGTVTDGTVLDPKYIWEITLNETPTESSSQIGVATGYLQCIGSGLYLQAYDGSTDMTPKLGDKQSEVIFKINFSGQVENGTVFCLYDGSYYYLDSDNNHNLKWVKYNSTLSNGVTTSAPSDYQYLAFETIPGNKGTKTDVAIQKAIVTTEGTTKTNEIVRNDFYYGIIPISISSSSVSNSSNNE